VPSDKTFVTEIATGLGMVGPTNIDEVIGERPEVFTNLAQADWDRLVALRELGAFGPEFLGSFLNGQAFLASPDALRGRPPRFIEWTGGRRPPGDEVVPADLRVDHVYLVSCKYLSRILHNPSPARLAIGLLNREPLDPSTDWFGLTAPAEYQLLFETCRAALELPGLPEIASELTKDQRRLLATHLRGGWPDGANGVYAEMCDRVATATALQWRGRVNARNSINMLWRLLRIGSTPYFMIGTSSSGPTRLRIDTPWDWRQQFDLLEFKIEAEPGGQARVAWGAKYHDRLADELGEVNGHVEIRWSHGRFGQPPEAKVYLDSAIDAVPGYHEI
jgi:hypothetical protein